MTITTAFLATMEAIKVNSEDNSLSAEVRQYALTLFFTMQAQYALICMQEEQEMEDLMEFFNQ
jgi:hypothetical protein